MTQLSFASGALWGIPTVVNPTPSRIGILQDAGLEFTRATKPLFSLDQLPQAVGVGSMQVKGTASLARFDGRMFNDLFFGATTAVGQIIPSIGEGPYVIPVTPYQVTVTNSATFVTDLGVFNVTTGIAMTCVGGVPITGQYAVSNGVYTFSAADEASGYSVKISYTYSSASTGQTLTLSNQPMGIGNTFKTVMSTWFGNPKLYGTWVLNACISSKTGFKTALEDFAKPTLEWDAYLDTTETLGTVSFAETN